MNVAAGQMYGSVPVHTAVACVGAAVLLMTGGGAEARRAQSVLAPGTVHAGSSRSGLLRSLRHRWAAGVGRRIGKEWLCLPAGLAVAVLGESVLPLVAAPVALPVVRLALRRRRERQLRAGRTAEVIELCGAVAGELRAGRQPDEALRAALADGTGAVGAPVMAAARFGGDVPTALREAAHRPGAEGLAGVAACWEVAADRGAGLAAGLERVAVALGAERAQRDELLAQLAGTRSTSVMLAVLPVFGLAMGAAMGARPLWFLLHSIEGIACLAIGCLLEAAGLWWTARIVRSAAGGEEA